ncbi:RNA polymerase I-specific transcription-initiation factor-domain-containing protein [Ilyonectria robusta]|uniref:RNA polymerase I-specific transcription-initiation factor-domain-containing protein n=1 Tax=Ilyonectria robusta TaxID=1079257 RepID=UPI001E8CDBE8|nr:RNA polymerase I-specific transcription-initiation factor-domain-containing protein [Ilyonectria robusta]KAH8714240.1 RNA polymerase I-specific transcription-initiation factor-domain-containing protein [Ilyonectria robusta]
MAEPRRLTDLIHGHVGSLTYLPSRDARSQPGVLHTSRITSNAPHFNVIGSSAELYPPSRRPVPEASSSLWQERRTQKRWLLQAHPEAFMGNSALQGLLEENMNRFQKFEGETNDKPLLAIGQMTNVRDPSRVSGARMLAAATGESGELLRLARIDESKWQWGKHNDVALNLSVIDPDDPDEEAFWISDGLTISQVKFATSLTRYDTVRWLLVQKQTSTAILQPEYHKVPVIQKEPIELSDQQRPSRIDPNPAVTLSHKQTGGNAHTDVAFNPGVKGQAPQLAIIDECGYWSVWDVLGTSTFGKNTMRLSINKCGHISEGFLNEIPTTPAFPAEKHGLLFVGTAEVDSFWNDLSQDSEEAGGFASRSQHILLWNREKFEVVDLVSKMALPKLPNFKTAKATPDWILDIQVSPVNQNHVFVLSMRCLYWIDLFSSKTEEEASSRPSILIACPHLIDGEGLRMTTCRASEKRDQGAAMVFTYSPKLRQTHAYWFGHATEQGLPQWHRQILTLPHDNDPTHVGPEIQSLEIHPATLTPLGSQASGPGSNYHRNGVHFYQGSILGKDLSVRYCIFASVLDQSIDVTLPTTRIGRTKSDEAQRWKRKRKNFLRHMGTTFVLPDGITEAHLDSLVRPNPRSSMPLGLGDSTVALGERPIQLKFDTLCQALQGAIVSAAGNPQRDISSALLSAVHETIENGLAIGKLSLTTWKEIEEDLGSLDQGAGDDAAQNDMLDLFLKDDGETVVTQLGRRSRNESLGSFVSLSQLTQSFSGLWLEPLEGRLSEESEEARRGWVADLARECFLATSGVMVQDTALLGAGHDNAVNSQQNRFDSVPIKSSQSLPSSIPSSPVSTTSVSTNDAAIRRLQLLSPSIISEKMASAHTSSVLSYWPKERGIGTDDYVSSVAVASDKKFDVARQRLHKIETRRKAHAEKYKPSAFRRQGASQLGRRKDDGLELPQQRMPVQAPAMQAMSSQQRVPESAQSMGLPGPSVTMSQPVSGMFGDRKKVKKAKKRSGFR